MGLRIVLESWKEVSDYLKRDIRTCQRYERELQLPIHRLEESPRARVFAYTDELDAWRAQRLDEGLASPYTRVRKARKRAARFALGAVLILAVAFFYVLRSRQRSEDRRAAETITIAVLPFTNASGRSDLEQWAIVIPHLLNQGLTGSKYYQVLGDDRITGVLHDLGLDPKSGYSADDLRRIEAGCGATHSVSGVLIPAADGIVITLITKKIGSDEVFSSRHECQDQAAIGLAVNGMADQVKKDLGLTRTTQAGDFDATGVPVTTSSLRAFRFYNEGRRLHVAGDYAGSAELMQRALDQDPEFALAWRSLAASLASQGAEAEAGECLRKALDYSRNASLQERYFIRSAYFQHKTEFGRALQVSREWSSLFPEDTQAQLFTGRACLFEEDMPCAWRELNKALSKGDRNPFLFYYASLAGTALGLFDDAARIRELGLSVHADNPLISGAGVIDAIARGQLDRALSALSGTRRAGTAPIVEMKTGDVHVLKGDFRGAELCYTRARPLSRYAVERLARLALAEGRYGHATALAEEAGNAVLLAYINFRRGRSPEGLRAAQEALRSAEERGLHASTLAALYWTGMFEALAGRLDQAKAVVDRLVENGRSGLTKAHERAARCLAGFIAVALNSHGEAVKEFRTAVALLPNDVPYLDDQPYLVGPVAGTHAAVLYAAAQGFERTGDLKAALDLYQRIFGLNGGRLMHPDLYALSYQAQGRLLEATGDWEGAQRSYAKFLELWKNADPGLPEVEYARARLAALSPTAKK